MAGVSADPLTASLLPMLSQDSLAGMFRLLPSMGTLAMVRRLGKGLLLLLLPVLMIVAAERHRAARGPLFIGPNQDPSYTYLVSSLQLLRHGTTGFYHHPGLPRGSTPPSSPVLIRWQAEGTTWRATPMISCPTDGSRSRMP